MAIRLRQHNVVTTSHAKAWTSLAYNKMTVKEDFSPKRFADASCISLLPSHAHAYDSNDSMILLSKEPADARAALLNIYFARYPLAGSSSSTALEGRTRRRDDAKRSQPSDSGLKGKEKSGSHTGGRSKRAIHDAQNIPPQRTAAERRSSAKPSRAHQPETENDVEDFHESLRRAGYFQGDEMPRVWQRSLYGELTPMAGDSMDMSLSYEELVGEADKLFDMFINREACCEPGQC